MAEKIISVKKYIEPITETTVSIPETTQSIYEINIESEQTIKSNHHKKIKKKVKIDNSIYDDILISNEQPIINEEIHIDNDQIKNNNLIQETVLPRVVKPTPRALIKKKKGH